TALAGTAGGGRVMATDPLPARRDLALKVGAEDVAWGSDLLDAIDAWTGGEGPPTVIDTTGDPAALAQATRMVSSAGRVVVVGMSPAGAPPRSGGFPQEGIDVVGARCAAAAAFPARVPPWPDPPGTGPPPRTP